MVSKDENDGVQPSHYKRRRVEHSSFCDQGGNPSHSSQFSSFSKQLHAVPSSLQVSSAPLTSHSRLVLHNAIAQDRANTEHGSKHAGSTQGENSYFQDGVLNFSSTTAFTPVACEANLSLSDMKNINVSSMQGSCPEDHATMMGDLSESSRLGSGSNVSQPGCSLDEVGRRWLSHAETRREPHSAAASRRENTVATSAHGALQPRTLHLRGDDSDEVTLLQLRRAISAQKPLNVKRKHSSSSEVVFAPSVVEARNEEDTSEGLEMLEDSLIGNDVVLQECTRLSNKLKTSFSKCMGKDRSGEGCVVLESPSQLEGTGSFDALTLQSIVRMLGQQCDLLKPYQVAALDFLACLMQRSVRGCIIASDAGLGARAIVSVWCGLMQCSNRRPLPCVNHHLKKQHLVALVVCPPEHLARWRSALHYWSPKSNITTMDNSATAYSMQARLEHFLAQAEGKAGPVATPCDVLLLSSSVDDVGLLGLLRRVPWLLAIIEDAHDIPREAFRLWRGVIASAHQRVSVELGGIHTDSPSLRNLLEIVQPQVMDSRQGNMLTLVQCASPAAESHEGKHMRGVLSPYILNLCEEVVVHQWARKQYVQRSSKMPEMHAKVYHQHVTRHASAMIRSGIPLSPHASSHSSSVASSQAPGQNQLLSAFTSLYQVAQHPLMGNSFYSSSMEEIRQACTDDVGGSWSTVVPDATALHDLDALPDITIHRICCEISQLQHLQLQPDVVHQASKCGSLLQLLQTSGPAVISSCFPAILDICALLLTPRDMAFVRIDMKTTDLERDAAAADFAAGKVNIVLLQQQAALKFPALNLSRASICIFYDSGVARAAEKAVEACCLRVDKPAVTTFCRMVTLDSMDEQLTRLQKHSSGSSLSSLYKSTGEGGSVNSALAEAVREEISRHTHRHSEMTAR